MKRLIDIPLRAIALAAMSVFLLTIGSYRPPVFVQANPATVSKNTLDPGESTAIESLAFNNTLLTPFTGLKPFTGTASAGGTEVTAHQAAVPRLTVSPSGALLYSDRESQVVTLSTSPPTPNLDVSFRFTRKSHNGPMTPVAETFQSVRILPLVGTTVRTGADGKGALIVGFGHQDGAGNAAYDRANNKKIEEKLHDSGNSEVYRYDSAYRLKSFDRGALNAAKTAIEPPTTTPAALQEQSWKLDGVGNWRENRHSTGGVAASVQAVTATNNSIPPTLCLPLTSKVQSRWMYTVKGRARSACGQPPRLSCGLPRQQKDHDCVRAFPA